MRARPAIRPRWLGLALGLAATLFGARADAQPRSVGAQASGDWQMPNAAPAAPASPPPTAAPGYYTPPPSPRPSYYTPPPVTFQPSPSPYAGADAAAELPEDEEPSPPFFDIAASTQVPLSIGALASLELPARLMIQLEAGWMPPAYGSAINGLIRSFAGYDQAIGQLIDAGFDDGVVVRLAGGWRPFSSAGFEVFGGYTYVGLSGSISPQDVATVAGGDFAASVVQQVLTEDVLIRSRLHNFHVGLGWRWVAWEHLVVRLNLAYMQTVSSSSEVETPQLPEAGQAATPIVDAELGSVLESYVKMPVFGASVGYRF
jgi:hypothetical protein